jgi:CRP-like cAMP-binding protein
LYMAMFHVSQIFLGWFFVLCLAPILPGPGLDLLVMFNCALSLWETNPFVNSEGMKLIRAMLVPNDREIVSWHFSSSTLIQSLISGANHSDKDFARICSIWGIVWLGFSIVLLYASGRAFGTAVVHGLTPLSMQTFFFLAVLLAWGTALASALQILANAMGQSKLPTSVMSWVSRLTAGRKRRPPIEDAKEIVAKIQDLPLFSHFHEQHLLRILDNSEVIKCKEKSVIIRQGDISRHLFVLLEGTVEIIRLGVTKNEWLIELAPVSIFGEAALISESPRGAQVIAKSAAKVLKVPVDFVRTIAEESKSIRHLDDFRNAILVNQFFSSSPVFRSLSVASVDYLCSRGTLEYFAANAAVFKQGDSGDSIFLMLRGSVQVDVYGTYVKRLNQGSFFGEIALIANVPRTATVITNEPCVFFKISSDAFWEVLVQHMDLGVFIETISESRLREDLELAAVLRPTGSDS